MSGITELYPAGENLGQIKVGQAENRAKLRRPRWSRYHVEILRDVTSSLAHADPRAREFTSCSTKQNLNTGGGGHRQAGAKACTIEDCCQP